MYYLFPTHFILARTTMTREDVITLNRILEHVLELPPEERDHYLDEACRTRPDLKRRIVILLDGCETEAPDSFLADPLQSKKLFDQLFIDINSPNKNSN